MEGEISRIDLEENEEINFRKPIMIGSGILIAFFILFGYVSLTFWFRGEIQEWIFGYPAPNYLDIMEMVLQIISLILGCFGLSFFINGLRKKRRAEEKKVNRNLNAFIILYSIFMIAGCVFLLFEIVAFILFSSINIPESVGWYIIGTDIISSFVVFGSVIMMIIVKNFFLKKNKIIDGTIVKRSVVHYFLLVSLIVWVFFLLNHYIVITPLFDYFHLPFISSQIITSFLAAGVCLELRIKIRKSKNEMKKKSMGIENGKEQKYRL